MESIHFHVSGMANSQSKTKLLNALDKLDGVQEVAIDLNKGTVDVEYNEPANREKIKICIMNTGYEVQ